MYNLFKVHEGLLTFNLTFLFESFEAYDLNVHYLRGEMVVVDDIVFSVEMRGIFFSWLVLCTGRGRSLLQSRSKHHAWTEILLAPI